MKFHTKDSRVRGDTELNTILEDLETKIDCLLYDNKVSNLEARLIRDDVCAIVWNSICNYIVWEESNIDGD